MNTRRLAPKIVLLWIVIGFVAVGFSTCAKNYGPSLAINLTNAPATLTVNQSVNLTATVGNDSSNAGVDWTCSGGSCGAFNPTHTASGGATIYTAPASTGTITITATATADHNINATATISIVPIGSNSALHGTYVYSVQGVDSNGSYSAAGTIVADGAGNITSGEQDYADEAIQAGPNALTGIYSIGPDGRGSLTLNVSDPNLPHNGVETFSIALTSAAHALVIQFDGTATSSGSLDLQSASALDPAAINGAFAFTVQGVDVVNRVPTCYGGVVMMSAAAGTVSSGTYFVNDGGSISTAALAGSMTAPDALGRGTIAFNVGLSFAYYAVQGQVLRLLGLNASTNMLGGSMFGQGAAGAGGTFSAASLTGHFAFFEAGGSAAGGLALAGQFSADGAGNLTAGFADINDGGTTGFGSIAGQAAYTIAGDGTGTLLLPAAVDAAGFVSSLKIFAVDPSINLIDPNDAGGGGGALVMDYDTSAVGSGFIVPQTSAAFDGDYAVNLQFVGANGENDWVGQAAAASGALTGTVDINDAGLTSAGVALTGTYTADAANAGRWTGGFTASGVTHVIRYYQVSGTLVIIVDTDTADVGIGIMEKME